VLAEELKKINQQFKKDAPSELVEKIEASVASLAESKLLKKALKAGDQIPKFILSNATGSNVSSEELLTDGPLVINFYRGGWWPFCNLELGGFQEILEDIHDKGAQLIAISPEIPDETLTTTEKLNLEFEILTDLNNNLAKQFGIAFSLEDEMKDIYKGFGIDLEGTHGNDDYELPVPATYVVDKNGLILLAHVDVDYTTRMEPEEVLSVL